jgi:hypothetical protein
MGPVTANAVVYVDENITPDRLESGMVLARDLLTREGVLLVCADSVLNQGLIQLIRAFATSGGHLNEISVRTTKRR